MNRALVAVGVAALVAVGVWWATRAPETQPSSAPARSDAAPAATQVRPLEPIRGDASAPVADAGPIADAAPTVESLGLTGVLGQPVELAAPYVRTLPVWRVVRERDPPIFENHRKVRVTLQVADGRVIGARATFPPDALSADVPPIGEVVIGGLALLPGGPLMERLDENSPIDVSGVIESERGGTFYWRGKLRDGLGDQPRGPEWFEIRPTPFGAAE